jgi:hypothetical protein
MVLNLTTLLLNSEKIRIVRDSFRAISRGLNNLPETFTEEGRLALWAEISDNESLFFAQDDLEFVAVFWLVLARYSPLPIEKGKLILCQLLRVIQMGEDDEGRRAKQSKRSQMKGKAVEAAIAVVAANGESWRGLGEDLVSVGRIVFDGIPFRVQVKLLEVMNWAYDFACPDELTICMVRLQIPFFDDHEMVGNCLRNVLIAVQANPGNEELKRVLIDEMTVLEECCGNETEVVADLAGKLILELEGG